MEHCNRRGNALEKYEGIYSDGHLPWKISRVGRMGNASSSFVWEV